MNLRYKPKKLIYQDFVTAMGLSTGNAMNPPAPGTANWPYRGYISLGTRLHGDAVPKHYADKVKLLPGYPNGANAGLLTTPWEGITPWIVFIPDAANTCTNAVLKVYDLQCQYFNKNTLKWTMLSDPTKRGFSTLFWFLTYNFDRDSVCDKIYIDRNPLARFSCVKDPGDRSVPSSPADVSKYRICHNSNQVIPFDYSVLGGLFVSVRAKVEPISGGFNATPRFLLSVGADGQPRTAPGNSTGQGILTGLDTLPAIGGTGPMLMPTDGSEATFIFACTKINADTYQDNTSDYAVANGVGAMVQDSAQFAANIPQIMSF